MRILFYLFYLFHLYYILLYIYLLYIYYIYYIFIVIYLLNLQSASALFLWVCIIFNSWFGLLEIYNSLLFSLFCFEEKFYSIWNRKSISILLFKINKSKYFLLCIGTKKIRIINRIIAQTSWTIESNSLKFVFLFFVFCFFLFFKYNGVKNLKLIFPPSIFDKIVSRYSLFLPLCFNCFYLHLQRWNVFKWQYWSQC